MKIINFYAFRWCPLSKWYCKKIFIVELFDVQRTIYFVGLGYYELVAFQNYIFNQNDALGSIQSCRHAPPCKAIKKIVGCNKGNVPCDGVRPCERALVNCKTMTDKSRNVFYACVSVRFSANIYTAILIIRRKFFLKYITHREYNLI